MKTASMDEVITAALDILGGDGYDDDIERALRGLLLDDGGMES